MNDLIIDDNRLDVYDEYTMKEEFERAFVFTMHDMLEQCQIHGFYPSLCTLFTLCSDDDKRLMLKAISNLLENTK